MNEHYKILVNGVKSSWFIYGKDPTLNKMISGLDNVTHVGTRLQKLEPI